ncbi:hypothetical protein [Spirobacillus cienkowskii]|uniref:hypothetical protein n=1 Tax=Spirobacillus cienkowskii TaxID=495820 RepID=UPI0030CD7024
MIKFILLLLFVFPDFSYPQNEKKCFAYVKDNGRNGKHPNDIYRSVEKVKNECKSGYILDFRVYQEAEVFEKVQYDTAISRQTEFCNYNKTITTTFNKYFFGFTCEFK